MFAKIQVIGNLGNDPEIRHLPSGTIAGSFSVAVNRPKYTDKNTGEVVTPPPTWFRLVAYQTTERGLVTDLIQKWLKKGQMVFCEGEPVIRKYTDQQGIERMAFEIKLGPQSTLKMVGGQANSNGKDHAPVESGDPKGPPASEKGDPGPSDIDLGSIPI